MFCQLITQPCVKDMIRDILNDLAFLDPKGDNMRYIMNQANPSYQFSLQFIITICKSLRHICAYEMLLNPLTNL